MGGSIAPHQFPAPNALGTQTPQILNAAKPVERVQSQGIAAIPTAAPAPAGAKPQTPAQDRAVYGGGVMEQRPIDKGGYFNGGHLPSGFFGDLDLSRPTYLYDR